MKRYRTPDKEPRVQSDPSVSAIALHGTTYNLFILVLTVFSLIVLLLLILPVEPEVKQTLTFIDTVICLIFFADFMSNLKRAPSNRAYFFRGGGWLDLLGSIPATQAIPLMALFRIARLARLARIIRQLRESNMREVWRDFRANRAQSAMLITTFMAISVITISAIAVLQVENARGIEHNIRSGGDAFWWAFVTITTVGYGDFFPTTGLGRIMAMILMFVGVGIFGVLTSYLAATFLSPEDIEQNSESVDEPMLSLMEAIRSEIAAMGQTLKKMDQRLNELESKE